MREGETLAKGEEVVVFIEMLFEFGVLVLGVKFDIGLVVDEIHFLKCDQLFLHMRQDALQLGFE